MTGEQGGRQQSARGLAPRMHARDHAHRMQSATQIRLASLGLHHFLGRPQIETIRVRIAMNHVTLTRERGRGTPMDDRTGGTWPAGKPDAVPKAPSPCPGPLPGRPKTMPVPEFPEGWGGFSGAKVNVDIRTTIAHPDCHSKNSPGEALRPCYPVISRKTADTSCHTTLETACKPALALGMHAEDLLEDDARESVERTMPTTSSTSGTVPPCLVRRGRETERHAGVPPSNDFFGPFG
ncbi:hypothetical protein [Bifidobacterium moukalabense]|uniref:hypothetical protein n=1 Tax=Bifidobacterium moukalabense TaxID=1333651 RepID=UPI001FCF20B8|nr:hypothetical protein [Bifidobacterium moukalabense]